MVSRPAQTNYSGVTGLGDLILRFLKDDSGATALEYALIAALVSVAIVGGATAVGSKIANALRNASGRL